MANVNLKKWLPSGIDILQWQDLMDVLSEELDLFRDNLIDPQKIVFDFRANTDVDALKNMADTFGYTVDRSLDSSVEYLQREIGSIAHRKRFKTTYIGYDYIYKNIGYEGEVFIFFYDGTKLVRASSDQNFINLEALTSFDQPFKWRAEKNFDQFYTGFLAYDQDPVFNYDVGGGNYDLEFNKIATKHVSVEYFIDKIIVEDSVEYLMTEPYLAYLANGVEYNRRAIEVPHNGIQLSILSDDSGLCDSNSSVPGYTISEIKLEAVTNTSVRAGTILDDYAYVKVGTGSLTVPCNDTPLIPIPTDLDSPLFTSYLTTDEKEESGDFIVVQTVVGVQSIQDTLLSLVPTDTINITYSENIPIQKSSFTAYYTISGIDYEAYDDGAGSIIGDEVVSGTIDYTTGQVQMTLSAVTTGTPTATFSWNSLTKETNSDFTNIEITEAGLFNSSDELITYATFPPIQYNDNRYQLGLQFILFTVPKIDGGLPTSNFTDILDGGLPDSAFTNIVDGGEE